METKKISKWDAAPESFSNMHSIINKVCDNLIEYDIDHSCKKILIDALSEVLDDYNELEAKHNTDCGLISDYAEENVRLKQEVNILKEKLTRTEVNKRNWYAKWTELSNICSRNDDDYEMLQRMLEKDGYTVEYDDDIDDETVHCRCTSDYIHRETTPDEVTLQFGRWTLTRPLTFSEAKANADAAILRNQLEQQRAQTNAFSKSNNDLRRRLLDLRRQLNDNGISSYWSSSSDTNILDFNAYDKNVQSRIDRQEIEDKDKLIEELRQKIEDLEIKTSYYVAHITSLKEKDGEFGKNVGKRIVDSIREGCNKGVYKLHPLTRIDIHVEETNNMPTIFDRYAIPRISVIFNNTQTEMERDTAEHECEELEKKFKELVKENEDLRSTLKMCERDANMSRSLCHNIAFNAEHARNKTPWFNDMQGDDC